MRFYRLTEEEAERFAHTPEVAMGLHFARLDPDGRREVAGWVLSGEVVMVRESPGEQRFGVFELPWMTAAREEGGAAAAARWLDGLDTARDVVGPANPFDDLVLGLVLNTPAHLPSTPARPAYIHGHLPFTGTVQTGDTYYRCEHWPSSRRIDPRTGSVKAGTYGFPASELPFVPTGFAAVGRYALPDLPPACTRYEIRPPAGYVLHCGASVPLYGQAGGGVEVMFPDDFINAGPMPDPTVLPAL